MQKLQYSLSKKQLARGGHGDEDDDDLEMQVTEASPK